MSDRSNGLGRGVPANEGADVPYCRGEPYQPQHKGSSFEKITQRAQEQETGGIAGLSQGRHIRGLIFRDAEVLGEQVENGMTII